MSHHQILRSASFDCARGGGQARHGGQAQGQPNDTNLAARVLLLGVRFYQVALAPFMISACKFYPSCSHYAAEAIERHGARRGLLLAAARLWRCRPFTRGGHDPVPDVEERAAGEHSSGEARA